MTPEKLGSAIGAAFGTIFVLANTGSLPAVIAVPLRVVAIAAFLAVLVTIRPFSVCARDLPATGRSGIGGFTRGYWLVVAGEAVAIAGGLAVLNTVLHAPQAAVAWISTVVGVHFHALAAVWKLVFFHGLGAALLLCGVLGLIMAATGAPTSAIDLVAGVLVGAILLGFGLWGATRSASAGAPPSGR